MLNRKFRITALSCALALGLGLLVVGKSASAQPAAPAPANNASAPPPAPAPANNASAPSTSQTEEKLPSLAPPRLASLQVRVKGEKFDTLIATARRERDEAIQKMFGVIDTENSKKDDKKDDKEKARDESFKNLAAASAAVFKVCNIGSDYIQHRLEKNGKGLSWFSFFSGLFAVGTAATPVINSAKGLGISSAALQNYKSGVIENGDSGHNNTELKKILDDVKFELANGVTNYNKALLLPSKTTDEKVNRYKHLQAAVMEMHTACAFF